jgi:hypothetical protein
MAAVRGTTEGYSSANWVMDGQLEEDFHQWEVGCHWSESLGLG